MGECDVSKILDGALLKRKKLIKQRKSCSRRVVGLSVSNSCNNSTSANGDQEIDC